MFKRQLAKLASKQFSRRLLNDVIPVELSFLNNLFINCNRIATTTGYAFSVKREYYCQILSALYQIRKTHGDLVLAEGYPVPKLPLWGKKGDITDYSLSEALKGLQLYFSSEFLISPLNLPDIIKQL